MKKIIYLQKVGLVNESLLLKLKKNLIWTLKKYKINVQIPSYELPLLYKEYSIEKKYNGDQILNRLRTYAESKKYFRILGIIDQDIFSLLLKFCFGIAKFSEDPSYGAALISIYRLKENLYERKENLQLLELRTLKEALHELGHTFGLSLDEHCQNYCVMNFSETVSTIEQKPPFFCQSCINKLDIYFKDL